MYTYVPKCEFFNKIGIDILVICKNHFNLSEKITFYTRNVFLYQVYLHIYYKAIAIPIALELF